MDPGARSSQIMIDALLPLPGRARVSDNVSLVIVSHSADVARGTADMVRQMVGDEVKVAGIAAAIPTADSGPTSRRFCTPSTRRGPSAASPSCRPRRRRDEQRDGDRTAAGGAAAARRPLQGADRRGRSRGGDRSLRRARASRRCARPRRSCRRDERLRATPRPAARSTRAQRLTCDCATRRVCTRARPSS